MLAPLAKFIDWSAIQILVRMPPCSKANPQLEEALQFLKGPNFIPAESPPARVEFHSPLHFRFSSPRPSGFAENNIVYGRLYRSAKNWRERPAIVLLHGGGDSFGYRFRYPLIARRCNRAGFSAVTLVAPYHFQRRPRQAGALPWPNYLWMAEATAQAIAEIRALTGWLLGEGCAAVGLWGFSFGGWLAGLAACHDERLGSVVLAAPRVRMNLSFPEMILWPRIRKVFQRERPAWEALDRTSLNLTSAQPLVPKQNILLIEPMHDLFVGKDGIEDLWRKWEQPEIWRLPHGHVSKALVPGLTARVLRWLTPRLQAPYRSLLYSKALACGLFVTANAALAQIPKPTDAPRPMTPEQSAAAFKLPDGFRMEVVASEPLIASPSAVCWDERGRMFVSELHGYNLAGQFDIEELNQTGKLDTQVRRVQADEKFKRAAQAGTFGVVKLLRDTNGDGRMDVADVWATNLPPAYGLVPARGGVIVACAPDIVFLADRDGDGRAETREVLFTGFPTGELERGINAPQWGTDGWIYFGRGWGGGKITGPHLREPVPLPGSDFRIRADGSAIEPVTGATHTFGFAMTAAGDRFTVTTTVPGIFIAPLPWRYLARNPDAATPSLEAPTGDRRAYSISKPHPWRQKRADDPAYFKYYNSRYGAAESEADGWFTAACGPMVYRDGKLPGLRGQYFVCEPAGNLIHRAIIEPDGSALKLRRARGEEKSEFAASTDAWSHPMNLTHGPDGCIWVTDYYREIIEDYSAIPRHLQQQYGVYNGHDKGRIYRLTHRDRFASPPADMSKLDPEALAQECVSTLLWRRQAAQRLLVERAPERRALLAAKPPGSLLPDGRPAREEDPAEAFLHTAARMGVSADTVGPVLSTLDQLGVLTPVDVRPALYSLNAAVRVQGLQLADRWFSREEGRGLLQTALAVFRGEQDPRVLIQFALSFGEARDPRAFAALVQLAREHADVRWMDAAVLSSVSGREADLLAELLREPGGSAPFLAPLARAIAARRNESELMGALNLIAAAKPDTQTNVLNALAKGRKNAPRKPLTDKSARTTLASLAASPSAEVRAAARALEDTFVATVADDESLVPAGQLPPVEQISEETFRKFVAALAAPRDLKHGHDIFVQACATCHRIGNEGSDVGPDLVGQLGMAEESLLKDVLMPNERIRPGFETTLVQTRDGGAITGLLKSDDATSLTLVQASAVEQVLLRKDVAGVRRLATSLMPSFAEGLKPSDVADLLAWLRSNLKADAPKAAGAPKVNAGGSSPKRQTSPP